MRSQSDDLLSKIVATPEDDDLRRLYADSLSPAHAMYSDYIRRSLELSRRHYPYIFPPQPLESELLSPFKERGVHHCDFYRGFVETIYVEPDVFMRHGDDLLDLAPILKVGFVTRDEHEGVTYWRDYLPELIQCPALGRVRELEFGGKAALDFRAMRILFESPHLDSLLKISPFERNWWRYLPWTQDNALDEAAMWESVLESPVFRRLLDWGLRMEERMPTSSYGLVVSRLVTRRQLGDRWSEERWGMAGRLTTYEPMSRESRALEAWYGYMPALHVGNWNATVLDVLRGTKPDFPAGARPTEVMYAVPPREEEPDRNW